MGETYAVECVVCKKRVPTPEIKSLLMANALGLHTQTHVFGGLVVFTRGWVCKTCREPDSEIRREKVAELAAAIETTREDQMDAEDRLSDLEDKLRAIETVCGVDDDSQTVRSTLGARRRRIAISQLL